MALHYETIDWKWRPLDGFLEDRLSRILNSWKRTPYVAGAQVPGRNGGVDCIRFVCGVLDQMLGRPLKRHVTMPPDTAMHNRAGAMEVMKRILREYEPNKVVVDHTISPCDVVVVGHPDGGPGHAMIAGYQPNTLWQASTTCVHYTGLGFVAEQQHVFRVYRVEEIEARWS